MLHKTGVPRYDPAKAYVCFVPYSGADGNTHLIDMDGHEVHHWDHEGYPAKMIDPLLVGGAKGMVGLKLSSIPVESG